MKLEFIILSIFLIASVMSININEMISGSERTFSNLDANQKYYFTIRAYNEKQYTFKIKVKNTYSSSSLSLSYIAHPSQTPGSKNEEEKNTFFIISSSNTPGYNTYESLYTLTSSSFEYVSFVLTPLKFIDSASITITESKPSRFTMHPFLVIFLAIVALCIVCGIIGGISTICNKKKKKKPEIEPTPKTDNYTPLTPQNQSPSPEQPYYAQSNQ